MSEAFQLEFEQDFDFRGTRRRETNVVPLKATTSEDAQVEAQVIVGQVEEEAISQLRSGAIRPRIKRVIEEIKIGR